MNKFARLPLGEQQAYFQETANRRNLRLWTVEKDFGGCWMTPLYPVVSAKARKDEDTGVIL